MHLPSARLHAGHAMATVQAAIELGRNALAIVLDHDQEISVLHIRGDRTTAGTAVLDDVADGLAKNTGGLHVSAGRQRVDDVLGE